MNPGPREEVRGSAFTEVLLPAGASLVAQMVKRLPTMKETQPGSIPGLGRSSGEGNGNPLQYSCLEKSHGWRSMVGYSPWDHKESDRSEPLNNNSS